MLPVIAVLLCAGFATRMYPMTRDFPKPLLPVANRPVLDYLMDQVIDLPHLESIHIVTNARFIDHFEHWQTSWQPRLHAKKIRIELYNDGATSNENRLGAIRDLKFVLEGLKEAPRMLVSAADNIFRFDLQPLWQLFLNRSTHYVIALPEMDIARLKKTGVLAIADNNRVLRLHEKPRNPSSNWSCPPLYFLQSSARQRLNDYIEVSDQCDAPGSFIDYLSQQEIVHALKLDAARLDIGSIETYQKADELLRKESLYE
jgi:glucose-1-phosphate thymidylyltransferase